MSAGRYVYGTFLIPQGVALDEGLNDLAREGWQFCEIIERTARGIGVLMQREAPLVSTDLSVVPRDLRRPT